MRRKKERSKQGQTNKQGKATQQYMYTCIYYVVGISVIHVCTQERVKRLSEKGKCLTVGVWGQLLSWGGLQAAGIEHPAIARYGHQNISITNCLHYRANLTQTLRERDGGKEGGRESGMEGRREGGRERGRRGEGGGGREGGGREGGGRMKGSMNGWIKRKEREGVRKRE